MYQKDSQTCTPQNKETRLYASPQIENHILVQSHDDKKLKFTKGVGFRVTGFM